jgi:Ca2+-binding RTX toxin-like protein
MTIVTFDFSKSYRGVTHTQDYYQGLAPQLIDNGVGYNGKSFADYVHTATLHHNDHTTETIDDRDVFHLENTVAQEFSLPVAVVLGYCPTSHYYDLWQHLIGNQNGMSLRVSAHVPPPPSWDGYVKTDYYGDSETDSGYAADLQQYLIALLKWEAGDGWLTSNGIDIPRKEAMLRDGNHTLGTIQADSAIDPQTFLDIANFQAIVKGSQHDDTLEGGQFDDTLSGNNGKDTLDGKDGKDHLDGGFGDDNVIGGRGNDRLLGSAGKDELEGDAGDDLLQGGDDADKLFGNDGKDRLQGGDGDDILYGMNDDDNLAGNKGRDALDGGKGNDALQGGDDADELIGDIGDDELDGGNGNDKLYGGGNLDTLRGGGGNDRLDGGNSSDDLFGGKGRDQFVFNSLGDIDTIEDFEHGVDKIVLSKAAFANIGKMDSSAFHVGPHATDADNRIIYWHNVLYYDADGAKGGDGDVEQVPFARIANGATLSSADFLLE